MPRGIAASSLLPAVRPVLEVGVVSTPASLPGVPLARTRAPRRENREPAFARMNLCRSVAAARTALATEEHLQLRRRHCLQGLAGRTSLKQRQLHRPIGIHEQSQELREVGLPATRQVITEHGPSAHQVGAVPGERLRLLSDFRVRQQGRIQGRALRFQWEIS